jgi:hypothetical protein
MSRLCRFARAAVFTISLFASHIVLAQHGRYDHGLGHAYDSGYSTEYSHHDDYHSYGPRPRYEDAQHFGIGEDYGLADCPSSRRSGSHFDVKRPAPRATKPLPHAALGMWEVSTRAVGARQWIEFKADATFAIHRLVVAPGARPTVQNGLAYQYDGRTLTLSDGREFAVAMLENQLLLIDAENPSAVQVLVRSPGLEAAESQNRAANVLPPVRPDVVTPQPQPQPIQPQPIQPQPIQPQPIQPQPIQPQPIQPQPIQPRLGNLPPSNSPVLSTQAVLD